MILEIRDWKVPSTVVATLLVANVAAVLVYLTVPSKFGWSALLGAAGVTLFAVADLVRINLKIQSHDR